MTRRTRLDEPSVLEIERHETACHAIPSREVRDLGDAVLLTDPHDADPFWNRLQAVRWPDDPGAFDRRLAEAIALFGLLDRRPHVWPSPSWARPEDLAARLVAHGFVDVGGGHLMTLEDPAACRPLGREDLGRGVTVETLPGGRGDAGRPGAVVEVATVLADAYSAAPGREAALAADLAGALGDARVALVLARVDGEPAAAAKTTTFDGLAYVSSVGTRPAFRGRGLGGLVTRAAVAAGRDAGSRLTYLGVFSGNGPALRLYRRLGFESIGESPDLVLE